MHILLYSVNSKRKEKSRKKIYENFKTSCRKSDSRDKYLYVHFVQYISTHKLYLNNTKEENILHTLISTN